MQDITGLYAVSLLLLAAVPLVRAGLEAGGGALRELAGGLCAAAARLLVLPSCPLRLTCGSAATSLLTLKRELELQAAPAASWAAGVAGIAGSHAVPAAGSSTVAVSVAFVQALLERHASVGAGGSSDTAPPSFPALLHRKRAPVNIFQVLRKAHSLSAQGSSATLGWPHSDADVLLVARPPMALTLADADEASTWDDGSHLCSDAGASLARPVAHATRKRRRAGNHETVEGDALSETSRLAFVELRPPLMGLRHLVEQEHGSSPGFCWTAAQDRQEPEAVLQRRREQYGLSAAGTPQPPWGSGLPAECETLLDSRFRTSSLDSAPSSEIVLHASCPASSTAAAPFAHAVPLSGLATADPHRRSDSWQEGFTDGRSFDLGQPVAAADAWRCGESSSWQWSAADPRAQPQAHAEDFQVAVADDCGIGLDWTAVLGTLTAAS